MNKINDYVSEFGLSFSDTQISQFQKYYDLLIEWNSKMNLTAITDFDEVIIKHFVDSVALIKASDNNIIKRALVDGESISLIDVGCGAGFPSIPLKIAFPNLKITMLDSLNKRINFLNEVINQLSLKDIEAIHGRAEDYAKPDLLREKFDISVSRAVANLSTLSEYCLPYVKCGGIFVSYKSEELLRTSSENNISEKDKAKSAIFVLGGSLDKIYEYTLPKTDLYRCLCVIDKNKVTPKKYPRKSGLPAKEPLC